MSSKRAILQNPCQKISVAESILIKLQGQEIKSSPKKLPPRKFLCRYIRIFNASLERLNMNSVFGEITASLQDHNFIKMFQHHKHFSQNIMFKTAGFWNMFRKRNCGETCLQQICRVYTVGFNFTQINSIITRYDICLMDVTQNLIFITSYYIYSKLLMILF